MSSTDRFLRRIIRLEHTVRSLATQPQLAYSSVEGGTLDFNDADGNLGIQVGLQYDGTMVPVPVNGPTPPTPAIPTVDASTPGGLTVRWDGTFLDALVAPLDFARVTIHATDANDYGVNPFDPQGADRPKGTISSATGGQVWIPTPPGVTMVVELICWSQSGKMSERSDVEYGVSTTPGLDTSAPEWIALMDQAAAAAVVGATVNSWVVPGTTSINGGVLAAETVYATALAANTITAAQIAAGTITTLEIAAGTIKAANIEAGTITSTQIAAGTITATEIAAGTLTATQIAAGAITTVTIAANAITTAKIAAGAITATEIAAGAITAVKLDADAINGKTITGATIQTSSSTSVDRLMLDTTGVKTYLASGALTLQINPTGDILAFGDDTTGGAFASLGATRTARMVGGQFIAQTIVGSSFSYPIMTLTPNMLSFASATQSQKIYRNSSNDGLYLDTTGGPIALRPAGDLSLTPLSNGAILAQTTGAASVTIDASGSGNINLGSTGSTGDVRSLAIFRTTTSSAANVRIETAGVLMRVSSSQRYKTQIRDLTVDDLAIFGDGTAEHPGIRPVTFYDKASLARYESGEDPDAAAPRRTPGVIAEEVLSAGLGVLVELNDDGAPETVSYDRLLPVVFPALKRDHQRIQDLQRELESLRLVVSGLTG